MPHFVFGGLALGRARAIAALVVAITATVAAHRFFIVTALCLGGCAVWPAAHFCVAGCPIRGAAASINWSIPRWATSATVTKSGRTAASTSALIALRATLAVGAVFAVTAASRVGARTANGSPRRAATALTRLVTAALNVAVAAFIAASHALTTSVAFLFGAAAGKIIRIRTSLTASLRAAAPIHTGTSWPFGKSLPGGRVGFTEKVFGIAQRLHKIGSGQSWCLRFFVGDFRFGHFWDRGDWRPLLVD